MTTTPVVAPLRAAAAHGVRSRTRGLIRTPTSGRPRWPWVLGCAGAAGWAAGFPLISHLDTQRTWGTTAAIAYLAAGLSALLLPRRWIARAVVGIALLGAWLVPYLLVLTEGVAQSEVQVVRNSAGLLLRTGSPYLPHPLLVTDYNPYFPGMALFGLAGDPRLWFLLVFAGCLAGAWLLVRGGPARSLALPLGAVIASPLVALPAAVGGVDLPMIGLCALALALAARHRPVACGVALAFACALKWTAWPALPVALLLLHNGEHHHSWGREELRGQPRTPPYSGTDKGLQPIRRRRLKLLAGSPAQFLAPPSLLCAATAVVGAVALIAPAVVRTPSAVLEQVVKFPLGLSAMRTPASSPLPGHALAGLGPVGRAAALALLAAGALAVIAWLVLRPPRTAVQAADRLAVGLALAFLLAPAGRFGYLQLPVVLLLWPRLVAREERRLPDGLERA